MTARLAPPLNDDTERLLRRLARARGDAANPRALHQLADEVLQEALHERVARAEQFIRLRRIGEQRR